MLLVLFCFAAGITVGLRYAVFASCFFIWNDIFRPSEWARYYGILNPDIFMPVHITTGVLFLAIFLRKWERRWNVAATAILLSVGWFYICGMAGQYSDIAIERAHTSAKYLIPLAFISATLCTRKSQLWFLFTLAASVGIWLANHGLLVVLRQETMTTMSIPGGQMSDRNDFLVAGTACIPLLVYVGWHYDWRWKKWVRLAAKIAALLSCAALFMSLSRGAAVGFVALLGWYSFLTGRFFKRSAIGAVIAVIVVLLLPNVVWERLSTIQIGTEQTESSARNRVEHMLTAVKVTLDYPLTGVGGNNFPPVSLRYSAFDAEPHSLWLKCSSEYGLPMLAFFVLFVVLIFARLRSRARLARQLGDKQGEALATTLSCALFGFLATGSFTSQFLSEYMWALIALIGAFLATPLEAKVMPVEVEPEQAALAEAPA